MEILWAVGGLLLLVVIVLVMLSGAGSKTPQVQAKPLLTKREREALIAIEAALPGHRIYPQVAMGALMTTKPRLDKKVSTSTRNRFAQKIVDFVAEDRHSHELLLIEVDDRTHKSAKDKERDAMTAAAGYRTVRVPAGAKLSAECIRDLVFPQPQNSGELGVASTSSAAGTFRRRRQLA